MLSLAFFAAGPAPGGAQPPPAAPALAVTLGFDGAVRPGAPVALDVRTPPMPAGGSAELIVDTPALAPQTGRATVSTVVSFQAAAGVVERRRVPIVIRDVRHPVRVRLTLGGRVIARAEVPVAPARVGGRLVVLVSDVRAGLGALRRVDERAVDAYVGADALPSRWQEYTGVDLLVLRDLDPARLSDAQRAAVVTWVRLGGRLLVIARPGVPLPAFLRPVLPARLGPVPMPAPAADLVARFGGTAPAGPVAAVALVPEPGAAVVDAGGLTVIAGHAEGDGYVSVWGIDPTVPPLAEWDGRSRLWAAALGAPPSTLVEPTALAERLVPRAPVDRFSHIAAGLLIALYIAGVAAVRRRRPTAAGASSAAAAAVLAVAVFATFAVGARGRSTALTQVVVLQRAAGAPLARAVTVAAAAVPYGGPVDVAAPTGAVAAPEAITGDLRIDWRDATAVLAGSARPEAPWVFQALTAVPLATSARFDLDAQTLATDLGAAGLRSAAVWSRGLVYPLGDLPAGRSTRHVPATGWRRAAEAVSDDRSPARFFREPGEQYPGAIARYPRPLLVGEWSGPAPVFVLPERGGETAEHVVLVIPIDGPAPTARDGQP
ncbi:MAG TPA: hypothetical protein VFL28_03350 [bacterium]|nr:hypothetical protein [bacterium]